MKTLSVGEVAEFGIRREEGESARAFRAFRAFLALRVPRPGLEALVEDGGYPLSSVQKWYHDNGWQARAAAFDGRFADARLEVLLETRLVLVVESLRESIEDARRLREAVMSNLDRRNLSINELQAMITARMELDAWIAEILNLLNSVSGMRDAGEGQDDVINRVRKAFGEMEVHVPGRFCLCLLYTGD